MTLAPMKRLFDWSACRLVRRSIAPTLVLSMVLCLASPGSAQESAGGPDRDGFTLLLNLGLGLQRDEFVGTTEVGLGGLNLGIGGFLTDDLALLFRVSGTNVKYGSTWQVSGVGAASVQYWANDKLNLEGGLGFGFWDAGGVNETGLGLVLGVGYALFGGDKNSFSIGVEYAPAFTDPETVHNVGIVFGWQLL